MKNVLGKYSLAAFGLVALTANAESVVNVYNWSDYIEESILTDFEKATGIKVVYNVYDSVELLKTKLLTGASGYDVVFPTASELPPLIQAKVFKPLDKAKLPNLKHEWKIIADNVAVYDKDNTYTVNYMWGTNGLGLNVDKIKAVAPDAPLDSWELLFNPKYAEKIAECGIYVLDAPADVVPTALRYQGANPVTDKKAELLSAKQTLDPIRPYIRKFTSSGYIDALANGDICMALGYSGDIFQAQARAEEANNGVAISYIIPKEGAQLWFDQMAIPADAKNVDNAYAFINYMLTPEVIAKSSNYVFYANGNKDAKPFMDKAIVEDTAIYPDDAVMQNLFAVPALSPRVKKALNRLWTSFKVGK